MIYDILMKVDPCYVNKVWFLFFFMDNISNIRFHCDLQTYHGLKLIVWTGSMQHMNLFVQHVVGCRSQVRSVQVEYSRKDGSAQVEYRNQVGSVQVEYRRQVGSVQVEYKSQDGSVYVEHRRKDGSVQVEYRSQVGSVQVEYRSQVGSVQEK